MPAKEAKQPIIVIKRIKKGGHAHHGGAWKIAYADFVTAMMAFFLLMWLLGSTSQGDLKGISDYFNAPLKVAMLGGRGAGDASSLIQGGGTDLTRRDGQVSKSEDPGRMSARALRAEVERLDAARLSALKAKVEQALAANPKTADFLHQVKLDLTPDGLRIQIVDDQNRPMFDSGSSTVKSYMRDLLHSIGQVLQDMESRITLSGHTDSNAFSGGQKSYSNWELSADRANASRRELLIGGMSSEKIFRVIGLADSVPLDPKQPEAAINRRISIIVMNKQAEERLMKGGGTTEVDDADELRGLIDATGKAVTSLSRNAVGTDQLPAATRATGGSAAPPTKAQ
jgi:chemotaxis protein MotB